MLFALYSNAKKRQDDVRTICYGNLKVIFFPRDKIFFHELLFTRTASSFSLQRKFLFDMSSQSDRKLH